MSLIYSLANPIRNMEGNELFCVIFPVFILRYLVRSIFDEFLKRNK